jgi:hypothetical protein
MTIQATDTPQISRIYNYVIGGDLHFEVDRQAAASFIELIPSYPVWAKLNRHFITWIANRWKSEGRDQILDLGSGLPTEGHLHTVLPDARILFTDYDEYAVEVGKELLQSYPSLYYEHADIFQSDKIIETASKYFPPKPNIAIGLIGVSYFLPSEPIATLAQKLYDWAGPGSQLAISFIELLDTPEGKAFDEGIRPRLAKVNLNAYWRTIEDVEKLLYPWKLQEWSKLENLLEQGKHVTTADRLENSIWMSGAIFTRD